MHYDCLILGAGAAGLFAARTAAARGRSVCVLDHAGAPGRKVLVAGGGKCNFTNLHVSARDFRSANPHFVKSALARFTPWDMLAFLAEHDISWEEREHGQLFCRRSASELVEALHHDCLALGVTFRFNETIVDIRKTDRFLVKLTEKGVTGTTCLIALGGAAWPQVGASDFGQVLARRLGHRILPSRPALVPLTLPSNWSLGGLSGIALPVRLSLGNTGFVENLLFTHKGISGPVVLQISNFWKQGVAILADFLPERPLASLLDAASPKRQLKTVLVEHLPERLVHALLPAGLLGRQIAQLSLKERNRISETIHAFSIHPSGTGGLKKAEATAGGVDTADVSSRSMESRILPGLHFAGEVLDVAGQLGGFNLHWAWASGKAAGESL